MSLTLRPAGDTPGSKVTQVANLVKAKVTGKRLEPDNEVVDLDR